MTFLKTAYFRITYLVAITAALTSCCITEPKIDSLLRQAESAKNINEFTKAENILLEIPTLSDQSKKFQFLQLAALMQLATCYLADSKYAEAIAVCNKALLLCEQLYGPNDNLKTSILFTLASAQEGMQQYDQAISTYNSIIALVKKLPGNNEAKEFLPLIRCGDIEYRKQHWTTAIKFYELANHIQPLSSPTDHLMNLRLALTYMALGQNDKADKCFRNCTLASYPMEASFGHIMHWYAKFLRKVKRNDEANTIENLAEKWDRQHRAFKKWLAEREVSPNSRFHLTGKYVAADLNMLDEYSKYK